MGTTTFMLAIRCILFGVLFVTGNAYGAAYGGAWSLRAESDVKVSFSWIGALRYGDHKASHSIFIEPMVGLSGAGIFGGYEYGIKVGDLRSRSSLKIRPKVGVLRTYNDPWTVDDHATYAYVGIECARMDMFLGVNGQIGLLVRGGEVAPSFGFGFGF